jgi:hypothetical protein
MKTFKVQDLVVTIDIVCKQGADTKTSCHVTAIPLNQTCPGSKAFPVLIGNESVDTLEDLRQQLTMALEEVMWHQGLRRARRPEDGDIEPLIDDLEEAANSLRSGN